MTRSLFVRLLLPVLLLTASASSGALAQTLILNGKVSTEKVLTVGGKVYVPLSALPSLGVQVSSGGGVLSLTGGKAAVAATAPSSGTGGANQKASVTGCLNEWLFNGVWRLRATKVEPVTDPPGSYNYGDGWAVTIEARNGVTQTITLDDVGVVYNGAVNLTFADGDSWGKSVRDGWQDKTYTKLPQGAGFLYTFKLYPDAKLERAEVLARPPQKLLIENLKKITDRYKGVAFTVPDPSFRVDLTCKK
ncbi:hypothetical protein [Deinococcus sp.]|uniref:hypothetical protein n=1 Tax=Deinococcus sp. TaxID=47478 RepID=UPI0025F1DDB9|nr:hypothetical protein [Deinococcus sp.]